MGAIDKFAEVLTGLTKEQRQAQKARYKDIKTKSHEAYLDQKEKESIKYARKKAIYESRQKTRTLRRNYYNSPLGGASVFGGNFDIMSGKMEVPIKNIKKTRFNRF